MSLQGPGKKEKKAPKKEQQKRKQEDAKIAIDDEEANGLLRHFGLVGGSGNGNGGKKAGGSGIRLGDPGERRESSNLMSPPPQKRAGAGGPGDRGQGDGGFRGRGTAPTTSAPAGADASGRGAKAAAREPEEKGGDLALSPDQKRAVDAVLTGKNIFITGGAGVGKSFLVETIVKKLKERCRTVQICASTGIAAVHVQVKLDFYSRPPSVPTLSPRDCPEKTMKDGKIEAAVD